VIRRLQLLLVAAVLILAAFATGLHFLFYIVYLAVLVAGGAMSSPASAWRTSRRAMP